MNRLRWIAASAIALAASPIAAAPASQFSPQRLSEIDKTLSSDAFQGRGTGAAIEPTVIDYIAKQLAAAGVQPGGDLVNGRRSWFQAVPLLQSEIVGTPNISLNENGTVVPLRDGPDIAVIAPLNGQKSVSIANAPLLFVGYGVTAPERSWDDFKGVDLHGKILVVLINDPDFEGGEGDFGGKAMTYYGRWTYKYEEAARRGAAGVMIVHETAPASYGWNVVQNSNTNAQFDIVRDNPRGQAHAVRIVDPARRLRSSCSSAPGLDFEQAKAAAQTRATSTRSRSRRRWAPATPSTRKSSPRTTSSASCPAAAIPTRRSSTARTGTISASASPTRPATASTTAPSTTRPASPQLIEQARAFAHGPRPERSVVFLAVTAEEKGLLGRNTTRPTRSTRSARPSRCSTRTRSTSDGAGPQLLDLGQRQARAARRPDRRRTARRARLRSRPAPGSRALLPLRPFLLRQGRRSGRQLRDPATTW